MSYTREVKKRLAEAGCAFHRQGRGDHEIWITPAGVPITVDGKIQSKHTANVVLKAAGLAKLP